MRQLMVSFQGLTPPDEILDGVRTGEISSFCLFRSHNVESPQQVRQLTDALHRAALAGNQPPPLIGIDQEGGQLMAVSDGCTQLPGNMALGATRSTKLAEAAGRVLGAELRAMGINLNFAPSVDVNNNPQNPVIGARAFSDDPQLVAQLGAAMVRGIQSTGVIATAKHFPGHGDTGQDTHYTTATLSHSRERLNQIELPPFKTLIEAGVGAVMTAHIRVDAIDKQLPATISPDIIRLLREVLNFQNLIITDAMDMHAVAHMGAQASIDAALNAQVDLILLGHLPNQFNLLDQFSHQENPAAVQRITAARNRLPQPSKSLDSLNSIEHQQIAQKIADSSITIVRNNGAIPIISNQHIAVILPIPENLTPADTSDTIQIDLAAALRRCGYTVTDIHYPLANPDIAAIQHAAAPADTVVIGTMEATHYPKQAALIHHLKQSHPTLIAVALRTPYDLTTYPDVQNYICTYGIRSVSITALANVLTGQLEAHGILPCDLPGNLVKLTS